MKVRIELNDSILEEEVVIRCRQMDENIRKLHQNIMEVSSRKPAITYYKDSKEYYIPVERMFFFETDVEIVYAHTAENAYQVKFRLYELEHILPKDFIRISKSTIINIQYIYSIDRNITASSLVKFYKSHKQVYVSRFYYKNLKKRLEERRHHES